MADVDKAPSIPANILDLMAEHEELLEDGDASRAAARKCKLILEVRRWVGGLLVDEREAGRVALEREAAALRANVARLTAEHESMRARLDRATSAAADHFGEKATRYKLSLFENGRARNVFPPHMDGKWFAFQPAEDDAHIGLCDMIARLTAELADAQRSQAGALDLVSRIRWAIGDDGARMQPELIAHMKKLRVQAEKRDAWEEALRQVEEEMPDGYRVTLEMSPGDWSLTAWTDEGDPIHIDDYVSTEQFIREAVDLAKEHHARKEATNG